MKSIKTLAILVAALLPMVGVRAAGDDAAAPAVKPQATCPVMGGAINKDLYVDVEGKRIYVCCKGCIKSVKQDPAKYIKALEDQGVTVASLQTKCPVMGGAVNKKLYADVEGKRVYVCCRGCIGAIKSDPDKWLKKLADENVIVEDVPGKEDK